MSFVDAEFDDTERAYMLALWIAMFTLHAVTLAVYLWRRRVDVIEQRNVGAFCVFLAVLWAAIVVYQIRRLWVPFAECNGEGGGYWWWVMTSAGFTGLFSAAAYRCLDLIARFEQQQRAVLVLQQLQYQDGGGGDGAELESTSGGATAGGRCSERTAFDAWFARHQVWLTSQPVKLALLVPPVATAVVRAFVKPHIDAVGCVPVDWLAQGVAVVLCTLVVVLAWKLRTGREAFGIKREFALLGLCGIAYCGPYLVWVNALADHGVPPLWQVWTVMILAVVWYGCLYAPVRLSYQRRAPAVVVVAAKPNTNKANANGRSARGNGNGKLSAVHPFEPSKSASASASASASGSASASSGSGRGGTKAVPFELATLDRVMALAPARRAFIVFLCLEFSVENMLFLLEVDRFRDYALRCAALLEPHTVTVTPVTVAAGGPGSVVISVNPNPTTAATPSLAPASASASSASSASAGAATGGPAVDDEQLAAAIATARADVRARALDLFGRFVAVGTRHEVNLSGWNARPLRDEFAADYAALRRLRRIGGTRRNGKLTGATAGSGGSSPAHGVSEDGALFPFPANAQVSPPSLGAPDTAVLGFRFGTTPDARSDAAATNAAAAAAASDLAAALTPSPMAASVGGAAATPAPTTAAPMTTTMSSSSWHARTIAVAERKHPPTASHGVVATAGAGASATATSTPTIAPAVPLSLAVPRRVAGAGIGVGPSDGGSTKARRPIAEYATIFDAARAEIHRLLESDSFPRWVSSASFDALVTALQPQLQQAQPQQPPPPPLRTHPELDPPLNADFAAVAGAAHTHGKSLSQPHSGRAIPQQQPQHQPHAQRQQQQQQQQGGSRGNGNAHGHGHAGGVDALVAAVASPTHAMSVNGHPSASALATHPHQPVA